MVATLVVGGILSFTARTFASITGSVVDFKALRGVQKNAKKGQEALVVEPTLVLTADELDALSENRTWVTGLLRAEAFRRNGGLGQS